MNYDLNLNDGWCQMKLSFIKRKRKGHVYIFNKYMYSIANLMLDQKTTNIKFQLNHISNNKKSRLTGKIF